jgi:hypothetical protein
VNGVSIPLDGKIVNDWEGTEGTGACNVVPFGARPNELQVRSAYVAGVAGRVWSHGPARECSWGLREKRAAITAVTPSGVLAASTP